MAGLYIHIPFCRKACIYCDFHFSTSLKLKDEMVDGICREISMRKDFFGEKQVLDSVYFGGGTPSVLTQNELEKIFDVLRTHFKIKEGAEITLEANPDDLDSHYLSALADSPINRLSIGIQSFNEEVLRWMNRSHSSEQARRAVEDARARGFDNLTADLILGVPNQSQESWEENLRQFVEWDLPHVSVYALAVEEKTVLAHQVRTGKTKVAGDAVYERQFLQTHEWLTQAGYVHYELSSYAKVGFEAQHNSSYWNFEPYLGVGPSAHSFDGQERSWNVANNAIYLKKIQAQQLPISETEQLNQEDRYHEYLMTHLRKAEGISIRKIEAEFVPDWQKIYQQELKRWLATGQLIQEGDLIRCSPSGWMVSDDIISDFF